MPRRGALQKEQVLMFSVVLLISPALSMPRAMMGGLGVSPRRSAAGCYDIVVQVSESDRVVTPSGHIETGR
jgi:hypothetical protein